MSDADHTALMPEPRLNSTDQRELRRLLSRKEHHPTVKWDANSVPISLILRRMDTGEQFGFFSRRNRVHKVHVHRQSRATTVWLDGYTRETKGEPCVQPSLQWLRSRTIHG